MNVKAVSSSTTGLNQTSAVLPQTSVADADTTSKKQDFISELDQRLTSDDPVKREAALKRQLDRSIRRTTGMQKQDSVSEEALFAGMTGLKLLESDGREVYERYADRVKELTSGTNPQEKSFEAAAKLSLKEIEDAKTVPTPKVTTIYSQAFAASQLDTRTNALYDSIGGKGDHTIAVADFSSAIDTGIAALLKIELGTETAPKRNISERSYRPGIKQSQIKS